MTARNVAIVGAGGFGREVLGHLRDAEKLGAAAKAVGFFDDDPASLEGFDVGLRVIGPTVSIADLPSGIDSVIIAIGEPRTRAILKALADESGVDLVSVVHPSARLTSRSLVGAGSVLGPFAFVGVDSRVGDNVVLNAYASVGHDATVGDHSVLSSYTAITGGCVIGSGVFTGTHATVTPGVTIGAWSKVAAGSVVTSDAPDCSLLVGNPAKGRVMFRAPE